MIQLPHDFNCSERGNILLYDDDHNFASWVRLPSPDTWLHTSWFQDNYPQLNFSVEAATDEQLWKIILENFGGYSVRKLNLECAPTGLKVIQYTWETE